MIVLLSSCSVLTKKSDNEKYVIINKVDNKQPVVKPIEPKVIEAPTSNTQIWAAIALALGWLIPAPWEIWNSSKRMLSGSKD